MSDKNDKGDPGEKPLSDSAELFDSIFSEEQTVDPSDTLEIKPDVTSKVSKEQTKPPGKKPDVASKPSKKQTKPPGKKPDLASKASKEQAKPSEKKPDPGKRPINKEVKPPVSSIDRESAVKEEDVKEDKRIKGRSDTERETARQKEGGIPLQGKPKKRLSPLVLTLSIVVLATLSGFFIHYYGIVDFNKLIGSSIGSSKSVKKDKIRLRNDKKGQDKKVAKKLSKPSMSKEKGKGKEKIDDSLKTPIDKKGQDKRVAKKVSPPSMVVEKGKDKKKIDDSLKTPKSKETTPGVKQKPSVPLHAGKSPDKKISDLRERTVSYPYSIYLGSFQTLKGVHATVSQSRKIGLSPYWVKLHLGDKGTWFRLFAGYFRTREGADTFIKVKKIRGAQSRHTKYANLIGTYTSAGALDKKQTTLLELGYSPYVISEKKDVFRLYVGAFYQKVRAEKQNADLVSKGVQSQFVKR
ncbi:MAG: SPOR domain-containing protein [Desulfobacteraceae bacterium]|nr:SPOR domain-containing protein [Desulfobacteraceae bacterium]